MKTGTLMKALDTVPETKLKLIELTWKIDAEVGSFESDEVSLYHKELAEAVSEANTYAEGTKEVRLWIGRHLDL